MNDSIRIQTRRRFLRGLTVGVTGFSVPSLFNVPGLFA